MTLFGKKRLSVDLSAVELTSAPNSDEKPTGVEVEINLLDEVLSEGFDIGKHKVGTDFLKLTKPLGYSNKMELTLWAYKPGLRDEDFGEEIELQVGLRDANDELDNVDNGSFEVESYQGMTAEEVLQVMIERLLFNCN